MSIEAEIVERETTQALAVRERSSVLLAPVMDLKTAMIRLQEFQEFVAAYLSESKDGGADGGDYGAIPGAGTKKVLLKSGADKLGEIYGLYDEYVIDKTVDWDRGLFDFDIKCLLRSRRDDSLVGTGVGSCSSFESKYRWRDAQRKCPKCGAEAIIKGKEEYGGGWLCWSKRGGCNQKFKDDDKAISSQVIGRVENPDIVDLKNTVLKMAKKRAKIDAIIGVTRSSGIFTQDLEDARSDANATLKEPPVVAEAKTFTKPSPQGGDGGGPASSSGVTQTVKGGTSVKDAPKPAAANKKVVDEVREAMIETQRMEVPADIPPLPDDELCTKEQQDYLRIKFKDALATKYQAHSDQIRRDFLREEGYKDEKGVGTSKTIPRILFREVCAKMLKLASEVGSV